MAEAGTPRTLDGTLGARVLREVIRTPAFREILRLHLAEKDPDAARETVRALVAEDPSLSLGVAAGLGRRLSALAAAAAELGRAIERQPPELLERFVLEIARDADRTVLREAATTFAQVAGNLLRRRPDLARELGVAAADLACGADLGKFRAAVERLAEAGVLFADVALDPVLRDPVAMANFFSLAAPLANAALRAFADALGKVDLPPEILASALLNTLSALDRAQLGRLATQVAAMIDAAHEGNLVLGRDEPALRRVLVEVAEGVLAHADRDTLARAAVALGEDIETALGAVAELVRHDPKLGATALAVQASVATSAVRGLATLADAFGSLPDEEMAALAAHARDQWAAASPEALGRRVNAGLVRFNRFMDARAAGESYFRRLVLAIDAAELERALRHLGAAAVRGVFASVAHARAILRPFVAAAWDSVRLWVSGAWRGWRGERR